MDDDECAVGGGVEVMLLRLQIGDECGAWQLKSKLGLGLNDV